MRSIQDQLEVFVDRIPRVRRVREMSQQDLADSSGLGRQAISKIETGRQSVGLDDAMAICAALDVSLLDMVSLEPMSLIIRVPID
jgi:transcriptional regulator with XRE-family HTH domain